VLHATFLPLKSTLIRRKKPIGAAFVALILLAFVPAKSQSTSSAQEGQQAPTLQREIRAGSKMAFDVASIRQNKTDPSYMDRSNVQLDSENIFTPTGGLFLTTGGRLAGYIGFAYKLTNAERSEVLDQLPKWAKTDSYAIEARAGGDPTKDQYRLMMQSLLADRFKLKLHFETGQAQVLAFVLEKPGRLGPDLKPHAAADQCSTAAALSGPAPSVAGGFPAVCGGFCQLPPSAPGHYTGGARNVPLSMIAESLYQFIPGNTKPVIDGAGLTGNYDLRIDFALHINGVPFDPNGASFFEALKDDLSLKLVQRIAPVETVVIDHIEEPSAN
jgi:bla regulator protein blaR1